MTLSHLIRSRSLRFGALLALIVGAAALPAVAADDEPPKLTLEEEQRAVAAQYGRLEDTLLKMARYLRKTEPERSELLVRALQKAREERIEVRMKSVADLLRSDAGAGIAPAYADAIDSHIEVIEGMRQVLGLLRSEDRMDEISDDKEAYKKMLEAVGKLLDDEKSVEASLRRGSASERVRGKQADVDDRTGQLLDDVDRFEAEKAARNSQSGDPSEGDSPSGEPKSGDPSEGEPGEGDPSEGQPSEGDPSEGDPSEGDPSEGSPSEGSPSEGSPSEGSPSEGSPSEGSPSEGEPSEGDPSEGEPSEGDPSESDPKEPGEGSDPSDPSEGSPSEGSPSEGSPSEGSPSEGSPSEGSPSEGSPSEGSPSEGSPSESSPSESQPSEPTAGKEELEAAKKAMEDALKELEQAQRDGAQDAMEEAIKKLAEAKEKLEEILRQLREEEAELMLRALEIRFQKMLAMQQAVLSDTLAIAAVGEITDRERAKSRELSRREREIGLEGQKALKLLREDGTSVAFPEALEQIAADVEFAAELLGEVRVDELTQQVERDIIESLEELIDALQQELEKLQQQEPPPGSPPPPGEPGEQALVDQIAELKMLRTLQKGVNRRTRLLGFELPAPGEPADPDVADRLRQLSGRQSRIESATYDLATGKTD